MSANRRVREGRPILELPLANDVRKSGRGPRGKPPDALNDRIETIPFTESRTCIQRVIRPFALQHQRGYRRRGSGNFARRFEMAKA
jgi:hypothetical protein